MHETTGMNDRIDEDDSAYFRAQRVVVDDAQDRWTIHVDPDDCLVTRDEPGPGVPTVAEVQQRTPKMAKTENMTVYEGPVLFSGGVIVRMNGKFVLIFRDSDAGTSPRMWTSPAGRGDRDPATTALKEFYEELALVADDAPIFVDLDGRSGAFEDVYERTLETVGQHVPPDEWTRVRASYPERVRNAHTTVVTEYGSQRFEDRMLATYVPETNTVELRFFADVQVSTDSVDCHDAELGRRVECFTSKEVEALLTKGKLVPPDENLLQRLQFAEVE